MKIIKDGAIFESSNTLVIEQMLKHGGKVFTEHVKEEPKKRTRKDAK